MQVHDELVFEVPDGRARLGARGGAAHHGRRRDAGGAARRRGRRRAELGRGALSCPPRPAARIHGRAVDLGQSPRSFLRSAALSCGIAFAGSAPGARADRPAACSRSRTCRSASAASSRSTGCRSTSQRGHIVGLIGPNGAGKTTLFNCLSRLYAFSEGRIAFEGRSLLATPPHGIAALGIGRTFQNLALFRTMTVRENVMLGGHCRTAQRLLRQRAAPAARCGARKRASAAHVDRLLALLDLGAVADVAGDGPAVRHAEARRARRARWRASRSCCCSTSRPAASTTRRSTTLMAAAAATSATGSTLTMLLVEHHMNLVMRISDQVVALNFGTQDRRRHAGRGAGATPDVIRAYLGVAA